MRSKGNSKLTEIEVLFIRELWDRTDLTQQDMAEAFGVSKAAIGKITSRVSWRRIGESGKLRRQRRHGKAKLSIQDVILIRRMAKREGVKASAISRATGMSESAIGDIIRGKSWGWV